MNLRTGSIILITTILTLSFILFTDARKTHAEDESTIPSSPTLFVLDSCPHCTALREEMSEWDLTSFQYELVEISSEKNRAIALRAVEICQENSPAVPLLFYENNCYMGRYEVREKIIELAGIPSDLEISNGEEDSTTIQGEIVEEQVTEEDSTESEEGSSTSKRVSAFEELSVPMLILMLAAPLLFIGLSFYMLKRFKL